MVYLAGRTLLITAAKLSKAIGLYYTIVHDIYISTHHIIQSSKGMHGRSGRILSEKTLDLKAIAQVYANLTFELYMKLTRACA